LKNFFTRLFEEGKKIGRGTKNLRLFEFADIKKIFKAFSKKEKIAFVILAVLLIGNVAFVAGRFYMQHTMAVPANGGTYIEGEVGSPQFINPLLSQSQTDKDLTHLVYAGLYKLDAKGNLIPDLAESALQISKDSKQYNVQLRSNLKWSDGQELNADDVIFTIQILQNPAYKSPLRRLWQNISVQKIDNLTIKFTNQSVSAPFLSNFTLGILPKHIWSKVTPEQFLLTQLNLAPVSSGPYFIKEIRKSVSGDVLSLKLESYSDYWQGKPLIDQIIINFYQNYEDALFALHSNGIQGFGFIPFDEKVYVDAKTSLQILKLPLYEYQSLFFNLDKSHNVLGDPAVRQALAKATDRASLINDVYPGLAAPAYGPIMPGQLGYNGDIQKINNFDIEAAKAILDKAGWIADPKSGLRAKGKVALQFSITTNDFVLNIKSAQDLKNQWQKIGADVTVNTVATADLESNVIRPRNFESLLFAEKTGTDPDPFFFWHSSQAKDPGFNLAQYKNALADKLISQARNTLDTSARDNDYKQFQSVLATDAPAIFLDQSFFVYEITPDVKGLQIKTLANPEDRFYDVVHWYIQTKRIWK
jgi:peptide/nickel transport system substrate-binding protein